MTVQHEHPVGQTGGVEFLARCFPPGLRCQGTGFACARVSYQVTATRVPDSLSRSTVTGLQEGR